uniref:Uncharacterized protein n=1 Tax=Setaria italica TaxID=4555 RepID=K3ZBJ7_SETIT
MISFYPHLLSLCPEKNIRKFTQYKQIYSDLLNVGSSQSIYILCQSFTHKKVKIKGFSLEIVDIRNND